MRESRLPQHIWCDARRRAGRFRAQLGEHHAHLLFQCVAVHFRPGRGLVEEDREHTVLRLGVGRQVRPVPRRQIHPADLTRARRASTNVERRRGFFDERTLRFSDPRVSRRLVAHGAHELKSACGGRGRVPRLFGSQKRRVFTRVFTRLLFYCRGCRGRGRGRGCRCRRRRRRRRGRCSSGLLRDPALLDALLEPLPQPAGPVGHISVTDCTGQQY